MSRLAPLAALLALLVAAPGAAAAAPAGPQTGPGALNRYVDDESFHLVTTAPASAPYRFESTLGYLLPSGGPDRVRLFSCANGPRDRFLSHDPACEGTRSLGELGYLYTGEPAGVATVALYRCLTGKDHFASLDPSCEGQKTESRLGYLRARGDALLRYFGGVHRVTAGPVPDGMAYESGLGFLFPAPGPGLHALHGCRAGGDHFLSLDEGCEGQTRLGVEGYAYDAPQAGEETIAVYRCLWPGHDHFASTDPNCEGQQTEALLGHTRLYGDALVEYHDPDRRLSWVTPGPVGAGYRAVRTLGFLHRTGGPNLVAIHGCAAGEDHFLSHDPGCEGQAVLGRYGFAYGSPPAGEETVLLYRCNGAGRGHFASVAPGCEGATEESRLGYVRTAAEGPPPAPACAPSGARVELAFAGERPQPRRTVGFGRDAVIFGRALRPDGAPAEGAPIRILQAAAGLAEIGQVTAGSGGTFAFNVPPGTSRTLFAAFRASPADEALACSPPAELRVRAGATLRASRRRIRNGKRVTFRGRVLGEAVPPAGKIVIVQAFDRGRWRTFKATRAGADGAYRTRYRFTKTRRTTTYRFRALVPAEQAFPYARGTSKTVKVRVRGARRR